MPARAAATARRSLGSPISTATQLAHRPPECSAAGTEDGGCSNEEAGQGTGLVALAQRLGLRNLERLSTTRNVACTRPSVHPMLGSARRTLPSKACIAVCIAASAPGPGLAADPQLPHGGRAMPGPGTLMPSVPGRPPQPDDELGARVLQPGQPATRRQRLTRRSPARYSSATPVSSDSSLSYYSLS